MTDDDRPPIANIYPITGQRLAIAFDELVSPLHPSAQELLAPWKACKTNGDFVMGRDVPAKSIASLTKNLVVLEPVDGAAEFRFRLVGSVLRNRFGREVSGLTISEVYDAPTTQSFQTSLRKVLQTQLPVFQTVHVTAPLATCASRKLRYCR